MKGTTHLCAGILTATALSLSIPGIALVAVGSLLPDIDSPTSKISHKTSSLPALFLEHRGITHSLLFTAALYFLSPLIALGSLTHLLLDMLNPAGIRLLWPLPFKVALASMRTNGIFDYLIGFACVGGCVLLFMNRS